MARLPNHRRVRDAARLAAGLAALWAVLTTSCISKPTPPKSWDLLGALTPPKTAAPFSIFNQSPTLKPSLEGPAKPNAPEATAKVPPQRPVGTGNRVAQSRPLGGAPQLGARDPAHVRMTGWNPPDGDGEVIEAPLPEPPPGKRLVLPLEDPTLAERVQITQANDRISLTAREAPIDAVLAMLAEQHGLNIIASQEINQKISVTLNNVRLEDALDAIVSINGCTWARQRNIILVTPVATDKRNSPLLQGRRVQVFTLNYISALDADKVVKGLLSPVGQCFTNIASPSDQRRTQEQLVVEDLPEYLRRIAEYIVEVDQPPRQVIVEAHVLEVTLKDNCYHGVNLEKMLRVAQTGITLQSAGFADPTSAPASFLRISGSDLNGLIECLKSTTNAKTLASPKLTVLNGQMAQIQIGAKLGYKTLQTTQTATLQNVNFLDTGVILKVTPIISCDNQIVMQVKPQVSDGQIDANSGLPNSNTTEVDTKVILADGEALVIGGLIRETDSELLNRVPILGDMKYIGFFFQRRAVQRQRTEIIVSLLTKLVPDAPGCRQVDPSPIEQTQTPLFHGPLHRADRQQWESSIPTGMSAYQGLTPSTVIESSPVVTEGTVRVIEAPRAYSPPPANGIERLPTPAQIDP